MNKMLMKLCLFTFTLSLPFAVANKIKADSTKSVDQKTAGEAGTDSADTLTAQDQAKGSDADVSITRKIRSEIVNDDHLSTRAKNINIITLNGRVTLKGTVASEKEKQLIEDHARLVTEASMIRNDLKVKGM